jgi:diguanylate cyclase (GGDEF)-like protein
MVDRVSILLVDADTAALASLAADLRAADHVVFTAGDVTTAMKTLLAEGPLLIITDWTIPTMDGPGLCRAIRGHEAILFAYIVIMTAHTEETQIVKALEAGADDLVRKPFNRREFLARVRAAERIIRLQQDLERQTREVHRANAEQVIANEKLEEANRKLNEIATTDELTGLPNRRDGMSRLQEAWTSSVRHGRPLSCVVIDLDHFKACNDTHGHSVGDHVLRHTAQVLRREARKEESVSRVGGEEFLVILPDSTEAMAAVAGERLRRAVEGEPAVCDGRCLRVTLSLGVAERTPNMTAPEDLLRAADAALYAAKEAGRNRVLAFGTLQRPSGASGHPTTAQEAEPPDSSTNRGRWPETSVLVGDDAATRRLCRTILISEGFRCIEAVDAADLLRKTEHEPPDVLVLGASIPGGDGLDCLRQLKAGPQTRGISTLFLADRVDNENVARALEAGADDYLGKPFHPKELALRVRYIARFRWELTRSNTVRGEQSRALDILQTFSHDIAVAETMDAILDATQCAASALTCARRATVLLADSSRTMLTEARRHDTDGGPAEPLRIAVGTGITGSVFIDHELVVFNTPEDALARRNEPDYILFGGAPGAAVPLVAPESTVGVLVVAGRPEARPFSEAEIKYLRLIANLSAAALHESITRQARDQARDSIVVALARLAESRDTDTGRHLDRVTQFCLLLARRMRMTRKNRSRITDAFLADLERAVPLHDIGKVAIPDRILRKPDSLTEEETAIMRSHVEVGARTLRSVLERVPGVQFLVMAEEIAASHHEKFDGSGYPRGLRGEAIPLSARIVALADMYDALTTKRAYKEAMTHEQAAAIILDSSGTHFDADVAEAFRQCADEFRRLAIDLADQPAPPFLNIELPPPVAPAQRAQFAGTTRG